MTINQADFSPLVLIQKMQYAHTQPATLNYVTCLRALDCESWEELAELCLLQMKTRGVSVKTDRGVNGRDDRIQK